MCESPAPPQHLSAIVGPVKQCLPLSFAASEVALVTMPPNLSDMAAANRPARRALGKLTGMLLNGMIT